MMNGCISDQDIENMLAPIQGVENVGSDLRENISPRSSYQMLRDARTLARNNERSSLAEGESLYFSLADWRALIDKVPDVLAYESKDIEIVAWYIEGLTRCFGFQGLAQGFKLARLLIDTYGAQLYPRPDEDGISTQLAPLIGLNGFGAEGALIAPIKSIPITQGNPPGPLATWQCEQAFELERISDADKREARLRQGGVSRDALDLTVTETSTPFIHGIQEEIEYAVSEFTLFQATIDNYSQSDPQPTGKILQTLKACYQVLTYIAGDRMKKETVEEVIMSATEDGAEVSEAKPRGGNDHTISDRQDALKLLRDISAFFRRTEPHSPISYSVDQIIRWSSLPLTELIKELIPDDSARKKYQNLSGISADGSD